MAKEKKENQPESKTKQDKAVAAKPNKESKKTEKSTNSEIVYHTNIVATCACGAEFLTGSTLETIRVDICSQCHPLFTGQQKLLDTEGRIEKFKKKYSKTA